MTAHKRFNSDNDDYATNPSKMARTDTNRMPAAPSALPAANARISELEQQVRELHLFIDKSEVTLSQSQHRLCSIIYTS